MKAFIIRPDVHDRNPSMLEAQVDGCELQAILGFGVRPKQKQKAINSLKKRRRRKCLLCVFSKCVCSAHHGSSTPSWRPRPFWRPLLQPAHYSAQRNTSLIENEWVNWPHRTEEGIKRKRKSEREARRRGRGRQCLSCFPQRMGLEGAHHLFLLLGKLSERMCLVSSNRRVAGGG